MRRYWLGTTTRHRGVTRATAEHPIAPASVRRLQYGIDLFEGAPTQMQLTHVANVTELTMTNPLPPEERRLLVAFGEDRSPRPGKFPLRYRLDPSAWAAIQPLLEKLGVRLVST